LQESKPFDRMNMKLAGTVSSSRYWTCACRLLVLPILEGR
jgi:hypothetical protein